jgi:nicotinamidase-related amidase
MPARVHRNEDLHGNVPESCAVALVLIDVLNDLDFPDNAELLRTAPALARNIAALKKRCKDLRIPVIYVNDNRDRWRSDISAVLAHCTAPDSPGRKMVKKLIPEASDYVVLKPKHSAFYATPLDTLISYLKAKTVILAGLTTSACILLTAGEVYVRDLKLIVASDCVAALHQKDHRSALDLMHANFQADTPPAKKLNLKKLLRKR